MALWMSVAKILNFMGGGIETCVIQGIVEGNPAQLP